MTPTVVVNWCGGNPLPSVALLSAGLLFAGIALHGGTFDPGSRSRRRQALLLQILGWLGLASSHCETPRVWLFSFDLMVLIILAFGSAVGVHLISGLRELAPHYDGFIVDLWGVLHDGLAPMPEAIDCLRLLIDAGKRIVLLSNAPRRADDVRFHAVADRVERAVDILHEFDRAEVDAQPYAKAG